MTKPARNGMPSLMNSIRLTTACATQRGSVCSTESSVCCPKGKWWLCDAHCLDCEFYIVPSVSLDEPIILDDRSSDSTLGDYVSDPNALTEKIAADRDLPLFLFARLLDALSVLLQMK